MCTCAGMLSEQMKWGFSAGPCMSGAKLSEYQPAQEREFRQKTEVAGQGSALLIFQADALVSSGQNPVLAS